MYVLTSLSLYDIFIYIEDVKLSDSTEQEKVEYLSKNFIFLDQEGKEYLETLSRQLLYVQCPNVKPAEVLKRPQNPKHRKKREK
jgi:hypothetical protein